MPKYLVYFADSHTNFRLAEIESLAELYNIKVDLSKLQESSAFLVVDLESEFQAKQWLKRSMLCRGIYEYWGQGSTWEELHESVKKESKNKFELYSQSTFRFDFECYKGAKTQEEKVECIESFKFLPFRGKIRLKNPDERFTVFESFDDDHNSTWKCFGRLISFTARENNMLDKYELKKRRFVGTTSFEAELSLVSVNVAQANHGKIMYDPFVGTGSFLVTAAEFGALTIGSDIDVKPLVGKGKNNIRANFKQYKTTGNFLDVVTMDFTNNAFRKDFSIDTICCDPPYGVREGLKVLGTNKHARFDGKENLEIDGVKAFLRRDYIPTKKPYTLGEMLDDLLEFSAERLPINGRLVFWMPVANDEDYNTAIPTHKQLELRYNCVQKFSKWSRRLLCYQKRGDDYKGKTIKAEEVLKNEFRERYFTGFNEAGKKN